MRSYRIVFVLLTLLGLVSCFGDENNASLEVNTDVYMIKKIVGEQPVYGVSFYAYGNQIMRSGTVTQVGGLGEQINLGLNPRSIFTLSKEPNENDYKLYLPAASEYKFKVSAESGATVESSDFLNATDMDIPAIIKTEVGVNQKFVDVSWTAVSGADGYMLKIADVNGNYIFSSEGLEPGTNSYTINLLTGNWVVPVVVGNAYSVQVHAFAYEVNSDPLYAAFNVEEISIGEKTIIIE